MADRTYALIITLANGEKLRAEFKAPQGEKGDPGNDGPQGPPGNPGAEGPPGVGILEITVREV